MFVLRKLLLFLNPILFFVSIELARMQFVWWWVLIIICLLLLLYTIWEYCKKQFNRRFFNFLITPFIFILSLYAFLVFVENEWVYHFVAIIGSGLLYLFLEQILNYFYFAIKYQPYTLENFSLYLNIISGFAILSSLFSSLIFLNLNLFICAGIAFVVFFALSKQIFWVNKIDWLKYKIFALIIPLMIAQLFIALSFLPTSFFVNSLILTLSFYVMIGLSRLFLLEDLHKKAIINYLVIYAVVMIAVLATAQWY